MPSAQRRLRCLYLSSCNAAFSPYRVPKAQRPRALSHEKTKTSLQRQGSPWALPGLLGAAALVVALLPDRLAAKGAEGSLLCWKSGAFDIFDWGHLGCLAFGQSWVVRCARSQARACVCVEQSALNDSVHIAPHSDLVDQGISNRVFCKALTALALGSKL